MLLGPKKPDLYPPIAGPFVSIPFSPYSKYFSPNVSRVELIPNVMSFKHNLTVDCWFFRNFLVKNEIDLFTRGDFVEGYIATAYRFFLRFLSNLYI